MLPKCTGSPQTPICMYTLDQQDSAAQPKSTGLPQSSMVHEAAHAGSFLPGHAHQGVSVPDPLKEHMAPAAAPPARKAVATPCRGKRKVRATHEAQSPKKVKQNGALTPTVLLSPSSLLLQPPLLFRLPPVVGHRLMRMAHTGRYLSYAMCVMHAGQLKASFGCMFGCASAQDQ